MAERVAKVEQRLDNVEARLDGKNSWAQMLVLATATMIAAFGGALLAKVLGN